MIATLKALLKRNDATPPEPTEAKRLEKETAAQVHQEEAIERAQALTATAQTRRSSGDLIGSAIYYAEAITLLRNADASVPLAHALRHAADVRSEMQEPGVAGSLIAEAIRLYGAFEPPSPLDLANAHRVSALNDERQARGSWTDALALYTTAGIQGGITECEQHIARLKHYASVPHEPNVVQDQNQFDDQEQPV